MTDGALHLYGVVRARRAAPAGHDGVAPAAGPPVLVSHGPLAALVTPLTAEGVVATAANLRAHEQVVERAAAEGVILPFRFGVVAESEEALVRGFLSPREASLAGWLERLDGMVEYRLTLRYREEVALREVVRASPRLQRLRRRIEVRTPDATYFDRIALGEEVAAGLERLRARDAARCGVRLRRLARSVRPLTPDGEEVVLRAALLVDRARLGEFDAAVDDLAAGEAPRLTTALVGPRAPWDFVDAHAGAPAAAGPGRERRRPTAVVR